MWLSSSIRFKIECSEKHRKTHFINLHFTVFWDYVIVSIQSVGCAPWFPEVGPVYSTDTAAPNN